MSKRKIAMIGNTHIDPMWLWKRAEGMQEVKSSFASALARLEEFPDFKFTMSSARYLEWLKNNCPDLFEGIRNRVKEGRWEIAGGMWVEPDCILPSGESLIRHFLYSKRFVMEEFGVEPHIGFNVDSFGHGSNFPAILQGCGMDAYIACRPGEKLLDVPPVFLWRSPGGASVKTERSGGEYLAWTKPGICENLQLSENLLDKYSQNQMAVFYGVGNHGGGPTIDNIKSIRELKEERTDLSLDFSTLEEFFKEVEAGTLPEFSGELGRIFPGCYSSDNEIKRLNRRAEWGLVKAEALQAMAESLGWELADRDLLDRAWKELLLNQFHDALSGTCIEPARDEVCDSLRFAVSASNDLISDALQGIANQLDTRGDGFPLVIANPTGTEFDGVLQGECYCPAAQRKQLRLRDSNGVEIPTTATSYQCFTPESRKGFLFQAKIPAMGWAVYRVLQEGPAVFPEGDAVFAQDLVMDNGIVRIELNGDTGCPGSITLKGQELLAAPMAVAVFYDDRGAWGVQDPEEKLIGRFCLESARVVETTPLRSILRANLRHGQSVLTLDYLLEKDSPMVKINAVYHNFEKHAEVCLTMPCAGTDHRTVTETAFLVEDRVIPDGREFYQHRFADVRDNSGVGVAVFNSSAYGLRQKGNEYRLILSRSVMFARGHMGGPVEMQPDLRFMDQGEWRFTLALLPHCKAPENRELFAWADRLAMMPELLFDSNHDGGRTLRNGCAVKVQGVAASSLKPGKEGNILRLLETEGAEAPYTVDWDGKRFEGVMKPYQIATLRLGEKGAVACDLLERPESGPSLGERTLKAARKLLGN